MISSHVSPLKYFVRLEIGVVDIAEAGFAKVILLMLILRSLILLRLVLRRVMLLRLIFLMLILLNPGCQVARESMDNVHFSPISLIRYSEVQTACVR